jgi:hypothetical protein
MREIRARGRIWALGDTGERELAGMACEERDLMGAETFRSLSRITHPDVTHSSTT